ncbi:HWE histidine kinase domain-containing protein [Falsiroseomonas sp. HW251]|uniref:HWE histidine kinase domain-containing protein n=1 Tax=Falsiroseomonas sp. HW251 TaxID=3390998 RepID=UPI003D319816
MVVPVHRDGVVVYLLHASLPATRLRDILRAARLPDVGSIGVIDRDGIVLARRDGHEEAVSRRANSAERIAAMTADEETARRVGRDGWESFTVFRRLPTSGWVIGAAVPVDVVLAPLRANLWASALVGALLVVLACGNAAFLGRLVAQDIGGLALLGRAFADRAPLAAPRGSIREVNEVGAILADAAEERRASDDRQTLLAREVDHRAKNALAVVQSFTSLTSADDPTAFKRAVTGRISALARVQTLLAEDRWAGADFRSLVEGETSPFMSEGQRVTLSGPDLKLPPRLAQPVAMVLHELATNAVKHGALSRETGRLAISWQVVGTGNTLRMRWAESDGPPVSKPPARRGFGSRVIESTMKMQLKGAARLTWLEAGLVCEMEIPMSGDGMHHGGE